MEIGRALLDSSSSVALRERKLGAGVASRSANVIRGLPDRARDLFAQARNVARRTPQYAPEELKPPINVNKPFEAEGERALIDKALAGADNSWAAVRKVSPAVRERMAVFLKEVTAHFANARDLDEIYVSFWGKVLEAHAGRTPEAQRYLARLAPRPERGAGLQGYLHDFAVPDEAPPGEEPHGTFDTQIGFHRILQGRAPANTFFGKVKNGLAIAAERLHLKPRDPGLGFDRVWYTPFFKEDGADGGYSVIKFVASKLVGGTKGRARYMQDATRRRIEVSTDYVGNHVSYMHKRVHALLDQGDLTRLDELVNWTGAAKMEMIDEEGNSYNVILHTQPGDVGKTSKALAIFKGSNAHNIVRVDVPLVGKWRDVDTLEAALGGNFALDTEAQDLLKAVYQRYGLPSPDENGVRCLPSEVHGEIEQIRKDNRVRAREAIKTALAAAGPNGKVTIPLDFFATFKGGLQYDVNLANPKVIREALQVHADAAKLGQSSVRWDAIIHGFKIPGTDLINRPELQAFTTFLGLASELMMPGRTLIPEAFRPLGEVFDTLVNPSVDFGDGVPRQLRGTGPISFDAARALTESQLSEDLTPYLTHLDDVEKVMSQAPEGAEAFAYVGSLHDEKKVPLARFEAMIAAQKIGDPFDGVESKIKEFREAPGGGEPSREMVMAWVREELASGKWVPFEASAVGNSYRTLMLGDVKKVTQAIALSFGSVETPMIYYRLLVGAPDNFEFALKQMELRLDQQVADGKELNYRAAFDARDIDRGPVKLSDWEKQLASGYEPMKLVSAANWLRKHYQALHSVHKVLHNEDRSVGVIARTPPALKDEHRGLFGRVKDLTRIGRRAPILQVYNGSSETKVIRISKADLEQVLGWSHLTHASLKDVLGSRMNGRAQRVRFKDAGDSVEIELEGQQRVWLRKRGSALSFARLQRRQARAQKSNAAAA
jgi:hypothetical protein